jgi:protein-disulfide isomerase
MEKIMTRFPWPAIVRAAALMLALCLSDAVRAQPVSFDELMIPGPLGDKSEGNSGATITLIAYMNFTCHSCNSFNAIYPLLRSRYIDTGQVHFIFRETVLPTSPWKAFDQAGFALARCADEGKYFEVVDALYKQQDQWMVAKPIDPLLALAKKAGFTEKRFADCLNDQKFLDHFAWVENRAETKFGLEEVPTFYIAIRETKTGLRVMKGFSASADAAAFTQMDDWEKLFKRYLKP